MTQTSDNSTDIFSEVLELQPSFSQQYIPTSFELHALVHSLTTIPLLSYLKHCLLFKAGHSY